MASALQPPRRVALVAWGNCLEHDFLHQIGVTLTEFRQSFRASWHFDYVLALRDAGVETTSFVFSCCRPQPQQFLHEPTNSRFWMLPAPRAYRLWRRRSNGNDSLLADYAATPLVRLGRAIRSEGCTALLVQGHDCARFDAAVLLGRMLRLPVFSTYQGGADGRSGRVLDVVRRQTFQLAAGLNVPSDLELARIERRFGIDAAHVARILNPIDTTFWQPTARGHARRRFGLSDADVVFAWHGRVGVQQKGLDLLVDAWRQVATRTPMPVALHLLGSGGERDTLERLLAGVAGVRWIDRFAADREEVRDFLSAADAYVFPSRAEGFAVAPLEALACGLPVIGSRVTPGLEELCPRGAEDGAVLSPTLDPDSLADALIALASNGDRRTALSHRAIARARQLSLQNVGRQLAAFLDRRPGDRLAAIVPAGRAIRPEQLRILELHPQRCRIGEPFNPQPDGGSAVVAVAENATPATAIVFDGVVLESVVGGPGMVTAVVPGRLLRSPRSCGIQLTDGVRVSPSMPFEIQGSHGE